MIACAIVRSLTMRRLTKTFCGPRVGPCRRAPRRSLSICDARRPPCARRRDRGARRTAERSARAGPPPAGTAARVRPPLVSVKPDLGIAERQLRRRGARSAPSPRRRTSGTCAAPAGCRRDRRPRCRCLPARRPRGRRDRAAVDADLGAALPRRAPACAARSARPTRCSAAPRRGTRACAIAPRSSARAILLVACRSIASRASSASIPSPSSSTRISFLPPSSTVMAMRRAPGVERVLDELLDDRGRALDDLAGGDLVREIRREPVDA